MKRLSAVAAGVSLILAFLLSGCGAGENLTAQKSDGKLHIVTSFYPLYELAQKIGGDKVDVVNLTPAGSEPHDFEPSPRDVVTLNNADLLIINGAGLEAWGSRIVPELKAKGIRVIIESDNVKNLLQSLLNGQEGISPTSVYDPHFWLDPVLYADEANVINDTLAEIRPADKPYFDQNTASLSKLLDDLDGKFVEGLKSCKTRTFVTGHAAFAYLSRRYNLAMMPIAGLSPDSEPSPKNLAELSTLVKDKGIKYVFTETLVSPKTAQTLADEARIRTLVLNPLEGLTPAEIGAGADYFSVMEENLKNLRMALECS